MYKTYKAYIGHRTLADPEEDLEVIMAGINERSETVLTVIAVAEGYFVLIVTRTTNAT